MLAKIRNTEIYFDVEGCGLVVDGAHLRQKPIVFVVHGGPGADHTINKPCLSPLSADLQLVYFDHRGQGRSARGDQATYTLENNVEDMEALRQYLGLNQIVVLGFSYGGMVSLAYAARYPQYVSHLIVVATAASSRFLVRAKEILAQKGSPEQQAMAKYLWEGNFRDESHLRAYFQVMGSLYALNYDPHQVQETWNREILSVEAINVAFGGFLRSYNILDQLGNISCPTLVIGGRHDWICPPEFSQEIAQLIPNSQLMIFENSGHSIRTDEPDAMRQAIRQFLA